MGTIADLNELTTPSTTDFWVVRDVDDALDPDKKMLLGKFGLLSSQNTWTANQAITGLTSTGSTLSVSRNLAAASTDAPVVDILQDHASDDQIALRIRQDGTGVALDITADAVNANGFSIRNTNAGVGAHTRLIVNSLGGDPYMLFQSGATPINWAVGADTSDASKFKISSGSGLELNTRMTLDTTGLMTVPSGINFGGATLNQYETGTFTPALTIGVGSGVTYSLQSGSYTRIGRMLFYSVDIRLTNKGTDPGSGTCLMTGFPFSSLNNQYMAWMRWQNFNTAVATAFVQTSAGTAFGLFVIPAAGSTSFAVLTASYLTNTSAFLFSGFYII